MRNGFSRTHSLAVQFLAASVQGCFRLRPFSPEEPAASKRQKNHPNPINTLRLLVALTCAASLTANAATSEETAKKTTITLSLKDVPASNVLHFIEASSGIQIRYTADPKNDPVVTFQCSDVSVAAALDYLSASANLKVDYKDDGVYVTPKN